MKFRHKPTEVEAEQYDGSEAAAFRLGLANRQPDGAATIEAPEGRFQVRPGDWVITGVEGERDTCLDSEFRASYEPVGLRLAWPLETTRRITQPFGVNPKNYAGWGLPGHEGLDFAVGLGESVLACAGGVVSRVDTYRGDPRKQPYGNHVRVKTTVDGTIYTVVYAHLTSTLVRVGQVVARGQVLGIAGSTGNSTGPHLHLTLKKAGATARGETTFPNDIVDPTPLLEG